jgi:RES domain-containing protein
VDQYAFRTTGLDQEATALRTVGRGTRYDRLGAPQSFYATLHPHVAVIELERRHVPVARFRLTTVRIKGVLLDAFAPEGLSALGLRRGDLTKRDNSICLAVADIARGAGCSGLLVPSAQVTDQANVVIWREAVAQVVRVLNVRIMTSRHPPGEESMGADG